MKAAEHRQPPPTLLPLQHDRQAAAPAAPDSQRSAAGQTLNGCCRTSLFGQEKMLEQ